MSSSRSSGVSASAAILWFGLAFHPALGQNNPTPEKKRLCVGPIMAIQSAAQKASKANQGETLQQTLETLDTTLIDRVNSSRKFEVVARKDALKSILSEQELGASGNVDPATAAKAFQLAGAQYLVMTTLTDLVMGNETLKFEGAGSSVRTAVRNAVM